MGKQELTIWGECIREPGWPLFERGDIRDHLLLSGCSYNVSFFLILLHLHTPRIADELCRGVRDP